jgi:hypothetical protein
MYDNIFGAIKANWLDSKIDRMLLLGKNEMVLLKKEINNKIISKITIKKTPMEIKELES